MRTTLNLDDGLYRRAKIKAAETGATVSELVATGLTLVLTGGSACPLKTPARVPLPLIAGGRPAKPGKGMTPERTAEIFAAQDADWVRPKR